VLNVRVTCALATVALVLLPLVAIGPEYWSQQYISSDHAGHARQEINDPAPPTADLKNEKQHAEPWLVRTVVHFIDHHDAFWVAFGIVAIAIFPVLLGVSTLFLLWRFFAPGNAAVERETK
jgi:hypothetical protein